MGIGGIGRLGRLGRPAPSKGGGVPRTLDVAGPELVNNGKFASDITGWTDGSSAGGAIAWNSGKLRTTNTSGTARARQACTVGSGSRYAFAAYSPSGTVNGSIGVGSTTPGSTDLLSTTAQVALAARAGIAEITAPTTTINIQLATGAAGNNDWDNITLRKLTPTQFVSGKVFTHDFTGESDGPLTVTPDNLAWRQMVPQNSAHVYPFISSGKLAVTASGAATTASYPYLDFGDGKVNGIHCDIAWTGTGAAVAMVSLEPSSTLPTVTDIITNSLHVVFTDTKVDISTYVAGALTTETVNYGAGCATDGTVYQDVGWFLSGSTLTIKLPDGTTIQRTDSKFAQVFGSHGIPEQFYANGVTGTCTISKVAMRLG